MHGMCIFIERVPEQIEVDAEPNARSRYMYVLYVCILLTARFPLGDHPWRFIRHATTFSFPLSSISGDLDNRDSRHFFNRDFSLSLSRFLLSGSSSEFTGSRAASVTSCSWSRVAHTCRERLNRHPRHVGFISACAVCSSRIIQGGEWERNTQVRAVWSSDKQLGRRSSVCTCSTYAHRARRTFQRRESSEWLTAPLHDFSGVAFRRNVPRIATVARRGIDDDDRSTSLSPMDSLISRRGTNLLDGCDFEMGGISPLIYSFRTIRMLADALYREIEKWEETHHLAVSRFAFIVKFRIDHVALER